MNSCNNYLFGCLLLCLLMPVLTAAQSKPSADERFYWVAFTDKPMDGYALDRPQDFLTERAIQRRLRQNIPITSADVPVHEPYVSQLTGSGATVWLRSRWLNGVTIVADRQEVANLEKLTFVKSITSTGPFNVKQSKQRTYTYAEEEQQTKKGGNYYGANTWVSRLLGIDSLHRAGFTGSGMLVAVLDGGFPAVDVHPYLRWPGQTEDIPAYDLVERDEHPYDGGSHGTAVLSSMAARRPGVLVGMAPGADYVCIKTESGYGEHRQEEYNWLVGVELADSLGADIVNSSLGYTHFDEADMNYDYDDLNGERSPASVAATLAADRGMLIVLSAGNEGGDPWKYISTPADGKDILAVGAVDPEGNRAFFSSYGPTSDGRMKPEVSAPGVSIPCIVPGSLNLRTANGTSLASPLIAGLAASLWQAFPGLTNHQIMQAIMRSGTQHAKPDNSLGNGVPHAWKAFHYLQSQPRITQP